VNPNLANGGKTVGSETVPFASGAGVAIFLRTVYALFVAHWHWWDIDPLIFDSIGGAVFFYMRYLNTLALREGAYKDQIMQAKVAKEWAAVPIPLQLLIEWANWKAQQPIDGPSSPATPPASEPSSPYPSVGKSIPIEHSSPSSVGARTASISSRSPTIIHGPCSPAIAATYESISISIIPLRLLARLALGNFIA
jgi:hypothetical protein